MKELSKESIRQLESRITAALVAVGKEFGVELTLRGGNFTKSNAMLKLEVATIGENGAVQTREAEDFKRHAASFGLKPEHLGAEFKRNGRSFKISGLNRKAVQYPILAESNGKTFKFPADTVVQALGLAAPLASLPEFLRHQAELNKLFGRPTSFESEKELVDAIDSCDAALSPENLTCDGELTSAQVNQKRKQIIEARQWLERKLGRSVESRF